MIWARRSEGVSVSNGESRRSRKIDWTSKRRA
jgi:hypothetical protein